MHESRGDSCLGAALSGSGFLFSSIPQWCRFIFHVCWWRWSFTTWYISTRPTSSSQYYFLWWGWCGCFKKVLHNTIRCGGWTWAKCMLFDNVWKSVFYIIECVHVIPSLFCTYKRKYQIYFLFCMCSWLLTSTAWLWPQRGRRKRKFWRWEWYISGGKVTLYSAHRDGWTWTCPGILRHFLEESSTPTWDGYIHGTSNLMVRLLLCVRGCLF